MELGSFVVSMNIFYNIDLGYVVHNSSLPIHFNERHINIQAEPQFGTNAILIKRQQYGNINLVINSHFFSLFAYTFQGGLNHFIVTPGDKCSDM